MILFDLKSRRHIDWAKNFNHVYIARALNAVNGVKAVRKVYMVVGGVPIGEATTWAYPNGSSLGNFLIPTYRLTVAGSDNTGQSVSQSFEVFRFGVQCKDGKTANVVGLSDRQTHKIKSWTPTYRVHSARSPENGGWQVYDNFLIHDGPDNQSEVFASIGCVEIMGPQGFVKFNDLLISLSGPAATDRDEQIVEIGAARNLSITYERSARPPLKKAP